MVLNTPIQGSASDIVVDAMERLSLLAEETEEPALQPVLNIHDDLTFCVPEDDVDDLTPVIVGEMLHPSFDWVTVPLSVEVSIGRNWADMVDQGVYFSDEF
jgi:DNA polymerase-1